MLFHITKVSSFQSVLTIPVAMYYSLLLVLVGVPLFSKEKFIIFGYLDAMILCMYPFIPDSGLSDPGRYIETYISVHARNLVYPGSRYFKFCYTF